VATGVEIGVRVAVPVEVVVAVKTRVAVSVGLAEGIGAGVALPDGTGEERVVGELVAASGATSGSDGRCHASHATTASRAIASNSINTGRRRRRGGAA
jgi:hypothetical protein